MQMEIFLILMPSLSVRGIVFGMSAQGLARLSINNICSVSVGLSLDNPKFSSLKESQSRQLTNLGSQKVSVSTTFNFDC